MRGSDDPLQLRSFRDVPVKRGLPLAASGDVERLGASFMNLARFSGPKHEAFELVQPGACSPVASLASLASSKRPAAAEAIARQPPESYRTLGDISSDPRSSSAFSLGRGIDTPSSNRSSASSQRRARLALVLPPHPGVGPMRGLALEQDGWRSSCSGSSTPASRLTSGRGMPHGGVVKCSRTLSAPQMLGSPMAVLSHDLSQRQR
mmetsp:Transcript_14569/g.33128  ORF Transcript_14569/g.33128 Transcript_14569/m.33128 type:complete len:206 (-) Transcript_14569:141-758(-)